MFGFLYRNMCDFTDLNTLNILMSDTQNADVIWSPFYDVLEHILKLELVHLKFL